MAEDFNYFLNKAVNITPTTDDIKKATKVNAIDQLKQDAIAQAEPKVVKEAKAKSRPFSLGVGEEGLYDVPPVSESVANMILWGTDDPKFLQKHKTVRLGFPGLIQAVPGWAGAVPLGMAPGLSHLTGGEDQLIPRQERKVNPEDKTLYWTQGEIPKSLDKPVVHKPEKPLEWRSALQLKSSTKDEVLDSSLTAVPPTKSDVLIREFKKAGKIAAETGMNVYAAYNNAMAGLGRILEQGEEEEGTFATFIKKAYQAEAQRAKANAERVAYTPNGIVDSANKKIIQGALSLLDPALLLMGAPVGYGAFQFLSALGSGAELPEAVKTGIESGTIARAFKQAGGLPTLEAGLKVGSVAAVVGLTAPGGLGEKRDAAIENFITTGLFAAIGASKKGAVAEKVYGRYAPLLGHEKALELSHRVDNHLRNGGFERDLFAKQVDEREAIFDDIMAKAAAVGSKMRGEVEVEQKEKVKKSKKTKKESIVETKSAKEIINENNINKDTIVNWLLGKGDAPKAPIKLYRGQPKGTQLSTEGDYIHMTPWLDEAKLAGKGAFGAEELNDVFSSDAAPDQLYYRGGSLAGDPLERTKIINHKGMTWTEILDSAKKVYQTELNKLFRRLNKDAKELGYDSKWINENRELAKTDLAKEIYRHIVNASFETDMYNRPGKWRNRDIPKELNRELPGLRTNDEVEAFDKLYRDSISDASTDSVTGLSEDKSVHYTTKSLNDIFSQSLEQTKEKTDNLASLIDDEMWSPTVNVHSYVETLINEVNRWYHKFEGTDIEQTRRKLSDLASRVEELRSDFTDFIDPVTGEKVSGEEVFNDYKEMVGQAAEWARRMKKQSETSETTTRTVEGNLSPLTVEGISSYAAKTQKDNSHVKNIYLVGSTTKGIIGNDVDLLYEFDTKLPKDSIEAARIIEENIENTNGMDLDLYDTFIKADGRYFHVSSGAGREVVENTEYGKEQKGKPVKNISAYGTNKDIKFYSGLPLDELKKVSAYFSDVFSAKSRRAEALADQRSTQRMRDLFTRYLSQSHNVKRELMIHAADKGGYEAMAALTNARSSASRSANLAFQAEREVFGGLKKEHEEILWKILFAARTRQIIDNNTEAKNPRGLGRDYWQGYLDNICEIEKIDRATADELIKRSDAAFSILKDTLKQGYEEGLYTKEDYENLKNFEYLTRQRLDKLDPETYKVYGGLLGKTKLAIRDSGLEELSVGTEGQLLEIDARRLLREHIIRIQNRIMANRAAKTLYDLAKADKDNPIVKIKHTEKVPVGKAIMKVKEKIPAGWKEINCWIDGKKKSVYMPGYLADEWIMGSREITPELSNWIRTVSGSNVLRSMATGVNIGFALKNLPRDLAMMWFASNHYVKGVGWKKTFSPYLPVAAWQIAKNVAKVGPDIVMRKGIYNEMVEQGVLLDFLSNRDRITKERLGKSNKYVDAMIDAFHYIGTTSELIGRAALYSRAKEKGLSKSEASYLAKDYLYFGDYGTYTKAIDAAIPYFGASIKATESIARSWARNPGEGAIQAAQVVGLGMLLHMLNQNSNDEAYKRITDRERQANWILPVYVPYMDKNGKQEYWYMKIPKDPSQAFFSAVGAYAIDFMTGKNTDSDKIITSLRGISPINQVPVPPTMEAALSYALNKDFWTYDEIWPGGEAGAITGLEGEHRETGNRPTNPALTKLGSVTGLSPERMRVALEAVFTSGNIYTDAFSSSARALFDNLPPEAKESFTAQMLKSSTLKGFFGTTEFMNEFNEKNREIKVEEKKREAIVNNELSSLIEHAPDEVDAYIDKIDNPDEQDRLQIRAEFETAINKLPHKSLWRQLYSAGSPEAAAKMYYNVTKSLSIEASEALNDELESISEVKQIMSDRFIDEYNRLDDEEKMRRE